MSFQNKLQMLIAALYIFYSSAILANENKQHINPFLGTWKLISVTRDTVSTGTKTNSFGLHPKGYLHYSADGRMMVIIVQDNRLTPKGKSITPSEAEALFKSMNSYAGTYTINHNQITHHVDISWNQKWTGTDQIRYYKFEGNRLILSLPPTYDQQENKWVIDTLTWEKIR